MQRMFNLDKWRVVAEGEMISFSGDRPRTVRLEVNCEDRTKFYVEEHGFEPAFLAVVEGRDALEFSANGPFDLLVMGGTAAVYTADGDDWSVSEVDGETFTRIVERKVRNPELELMMYQAQQNAEARFAAQSEELERRLTARYSAMAATAGTAAVGGTVDPPAGVADGGTAGDSTAQAAGAGASVVAPPVPQAPAGGGTNGHAG